MVCLGMVLATACSISGEAESVEPVARWTAAVFPSGAQFTLELAVTEQERSLGYMDREEIGDNEGMLFVFDAPGRHGMWMKNCLVNLDIIWLDDRFRVVDMAFDLPPCPERGKCPTVYSSSTASFVLEVAGGRAETEHLHPGETIVMLSEGDRQ